jgi:hypothetical protein
LDNYLREQHTHKKSKITVVCVLVFTFLDTTLEGKKGKVKGKDIPVTGRGGL